MLLASLAEDSHLVRKSAGIHASSALTSLQSVGAGKAAGAEARSVILNILHNLIDNPAVLSIYTELLLNHFVITYLFPASTGSSA
mgnify:CR=1 FL=1